MRCNKPPSIVQAAIAVMDYKFVRGKKRATEDIERYCLGEYNAKRRPDGEYELKVPTAATKNLTKRWRNRWETS